MVMGELACGGSGRCRAARLKRRGGLRRTQGLLTHGASLGALEGHETRARRRTVTLASGRQGVSYSRTAVVASRKTADPEHRHGLLFAVSWSRPIATGILLAGRVMVSDAGDMHAPGWIPQPGLGCIIIDGRQKESR